MIYIYNKKTGERLYVHSIDANDIIASGEYVMHKSKVEKRVYKKKVVE